MYSYSKKSFLHFDTLISVQEWIYPWKFFKMYLGVPLPNNCNIFNGTDTQNSFSVIELSAFDLYLVYLSLICKIYKGEN